MPSWLPAPRRARQSENWPHGPERTARPSCGTLSKVGLGLRVCGATVEEVDPASDLGPIGGLLSGSTGGHDALQLRALGRQQPNSTATRFGNRMRKGAFGVSHHNRRTRHEFHSYINQ